MILLFLGAEFAANAECGRQNMRLFRPGNCRSLGSEGEVQADP